MKIVIVAADLRIGGSQRYLSELANNWCRNGHEISIIVLRNEDLFYTLSQDIKIIKLNYGFKGRWSKFFSGIYTIFQLKKNIKQANPDFVLSNLSSTNILTLIATFFSKTKVFVRDAFGPARRRNALEKIARKYLYSVASGIIAQTVEIKEYIKRETGSSNVKVIQNPVRRFPRHKKIKREKIILNVGSLIKRKGQKYFMEACALINNPEWKFVILGDGENRKDLEDHIIKLNLKGRLELMGAVKNVDEWLMKSSIFVFPSLLEGLPNALIEAMAAGLPCISFDCETGPRDLINDKVNGFLVPQGDLNLMVKRIKELINNAELRNKFSDEAIITTQKFNVEIIAQEVLDFCSKS